MSTTSITVNNRQIIDESVIGAMICKTPKVPIVDGKLNTCMLVRYAEDLINNFGDPYIDPSSYTDLIIAYDLVSNGIPIYISSIDDMTHNDDDFTIPYNGYTEFNFIDNGLRKSIGYKLKSNIKFCQPIIQFNVSANVLNLSVSTYLLDRKHTIYKDNINKFDVSRLYQTYVFSFDISKIPSNEDNIDDNSITDESIVSALSDFGFELKLINCYSKVDFVNKLLEFKRLNVSISQPVEPNVIAMPNSDSFDSIDDYEAALDEYNEYISRTLPTYQSSLLDLGYVYDIHSNNYSYRLDDSDAVINEYSNAINNIHDMLVQPHWLCISQITKSETVYDNNDIIRSSMIDLDPESYLVIFYHLLSTFTDDSDTYLFISMPDVSVATAIKLLTCNGEFTNAYSLPSQYNCDLFFGYITDYIESSLQYRIPTRVNYSASILSMYNLIINRLRYMTNSLSNLNIPNGSVKLVISESSAEDFANIRCNTPVLFETNSISVYGDRSLSLLPNLRYSHISRNLVLIRRLVREYLATQQFAVSTLFNIQSIINYIKTSILDQFVSNGILQKYDVSSYSLDKTINIKLSLLFSGVVRSIDLDFSI